MDTERYSELKRDVLADVLRGFRVSESEIDQSYFLRMCTSVIESITGDQANVTVEWHGVGKDRQNSVSIDVLYYGDEAMSADSLAELFTALTSIPCAVFVLTVSSRASTI